MEKIDDLLNSIPKDKPTADFTSAVMQKVFETAALESRQEATLEQLLQRQIPAKSPVNLSMGVMKHLTTPKKEKPLISKWGWTAVTLIAMAVSVIYFTQPDENQLQIDFNFSEVPMVYPLSVFALGVLIFLDYILRSRRFKEA